MPIPVIDEVKNSSFIGIDIDSKPFQVAVERFASETQSLPPADLWHKLSKCRNARFDLHSKYLGIEESIEWVNKWLAFQFGPHKTGIMLDSHYWGVLIVVLI